MKGYVKKKTVCGRPLVVRVRIVPSSEFPQNTYNTFSSHSEISHNPFGMPVSTKSVRLSTIEVLIGFVKGAEEFGLSTPRRFSFTAIEVSVCDYIQVTPQYIFCNTILASVTHTSI